ncbi:hypothetical protein FQR65_LT02678 [Abscondita terminalis]|nr:hypothetical protein FQR65_LT02678 [Abscondita terminalis]
MNTSVQLKNFPKVVRFFSSKPLWDEIKIPVSWGHIAGKWWGPQDKRPILVLHGWQENCGSFDRLIPLLNPRKGYLAVDFPGHGLSSSLPLGVSYHWIDYVIAVRRITKYFNWSKVSILGHSLGGAAGYYYEIVYPGEVEFLITIDSLHPTVNDLNLTSNGKDIDRLIKYDSLVAQGKEGPTYTKQELIERLHRESYKSIDRDMCEYVLKRNIKESSETPSKFFFTRDIRAKVLPLLNKNRNEMMQTVNRLLCPILYLQASTNIAQYDAMTKVQEDNCGSFDTLIPCLPSNLAILALDIPGHGLSSHFFPGMFYHGVDSVVIIKRIVQFFNWDKVSLLGHSLGGTFAYLYVMLYPETIDFIINLDAVKPLVITNRKFERMSKSVETFLKYERVERDTEPPCYTFEEWEHMLHEGSGKSIDLKNCKYILERNIAPSKSEPHKFVITRDLRVKVPPIIRLSQNDIVERTKKITVPYFVSKSDGFPLVENKKCTLDVLELLKEDNCGSFDTLIPCLPSNLAILALDSPGHGLSSEFPPGMFYNGFDSVIIMRRLIKFLRWDKVSLLGHSLGGLYNYLYFMLYPDTIDFVINLDIIKPIVIEDKKFERMIKSVETFLKYESTTERKIEPPSYSFQELERMQYEGSRKSISLENCKYILERNIAPSKLDPYKFVITRDLRVKVSPLLTMTQKDIVERTKKITFPYFVSRSTGFPILENKKYTLEVLEILKKVNKDFWYREVEGTHHVHLNNPERIAELIIPFIQKYDVHDRSKGGLIEEIRIKSKNSVDIPVLV